MNIMRSIYLLVSCLLFVLYSPSLLAHGSVVAEGDLCLIKIGFYTSHFKIFQPLASKEKEYCEDIPASGESIFVMEYRHQELATVPIEFRIINNITGKGRFAKLEDVQAIKDIDAITVFYQPPTIESQVFTALHNFEQEGNFLGIVTVKHPQTDRYYSAVFPFSVGVNSWGMIPMFVGFALLAQLIYWTSSGGFGRWRIATKAKSNKRNGFAIKYRPMLILATSFVLMGASSETTRAQPSWVSDSGSLTVTFKSEINPLPINQMHNWTLHLQDQNGMPVANALITLTGGMPVHNHGFPTNPVMTQYLGNGNYRVEGIRFHMQGDWVLNLVITTVDFMDTVLISVTL
jgi:hypothetical protein